MLREWQLLDAWQTTFELEGNKENTFIGMTEILLKLRKYAIKSTK